MAEAVKVIVRCRPMNGREKDLKCNCVVKMDNSRGQCSIQNPSEAKAPPKSFTFDGAYFTDSTTEQIYADIAYPLVEGVTEGYNGTIFAYGQTGCGKSFSMQGITDPASQRGIIPRAFDHIFETISVTEGCKFLVHASYLEIYNEEIRDLLGADSKKKIDLHEHPEKGVYVHGLTMHPVHNVQDCAKVMGHGWKNRSVGATLMNADSSRSHSIFTINLEMSESDDTGEEHIRAGKLNLVDLAGSERQGKTGATGDRLKEATKINLSLSALGNVISALVDGKSKHIPYRDSKLTRLLQDSLGGNTKTLMVACLSPADNNYDETLSTLRYANRAKNIKNKPKINEDPKDALLRQYQEEIEQLKKMLLGQAPIPAGGIQAASGTAAIAPAEKVVETVVETKIVEKIIDNSKDIEAEKERLQSEFDKQLEDMKQKYERERTDKAKLANDMNKLRDFYDSKLSQLEDNNLPPSAQVLAENAAPVAEAENTQTPPSEKNIPKASPRPSMATKKETENSVETVDSLKISETPVIDETEEDVLDPSLNESAELSKLLVTPRDAEVPASNENETPSDAPGVDAAKSNVGSDGSLVLNNQAFERPGSASHPAVPREPPVAVIGSNGEPAVASNEAVRPEVMSVVSADGLHTPDELQNAQRAVHIGSTREEGEIPAPRSSPTAESQQVIAQEEAMKRLQALQEQMVGGEALNNSEVKERRKKRKKHAEEKKRKLAEAVQNMDDDGIMIGIYDSVQDELKAMKKKFENEKQKTEGLEREIVDLQSEFEFDRIDYLDTIRKQDQQLKLLQALIDKIHPCIRRDCNYSNLDKVRSECKWDDENQRWLLPNLLLEKTTLPSGLMAGGRTDMRGGKPRMNGDMRPVFDTPPEEDRFRQKLLNSAEQDVANNYFKPKRANQLLNQTQETRNIDPVFIHPLQANQMNGGASPNGAMPWHSETTDLRAAAVHGQLKPDDYPMRKPTRLQSLPSGKGNRKKKKQSPLDPL